MAHARTKGLTGRPSYCPPSFLVCQVSYCRLTARHRQFSSPTLHRRSRVFLVCRGEDSCHDENESDEVDHQWGESLRDSGPHPPGTSLLYMPRKLVATEDFDSDDARNLPAVVNVGRTNGLVSPRAVDHSTEQKPLIGSRLCQDEVRMRTREKVGTPTPSKSRDCAERRLRRESLDVIASEHYEDSSRPDQTKHDPDPAIYLPDPPNPCEVDQREDYRQQKLPVHRLLMCHDRIIRRTGRFAVELSPMRK